MIRIAKPTTPPAILRNRGKEKRQAHCDDFDTSPDDYRAGTKRVGFDQTLYNAKSVKSALLKAQHSKCCYCEWKTDPGSFGDVEHFRPKAGYQQKTGDPLARPGYYWLAYEWSNLYLSCQVCNQRFKKNLFPLEDPSNRALCHSDPLEGERPLLIDPGTMNPSLYIEFRREFAQAIGENAIGMATIEVFQLNDRSSLVENRRAILKRIDLIQENRYLLVAAMDAGHISARHEAQLVKLDAFLTESIEDSAEYAAMARAALAK